MKRTLPVVSRMYVVGIVSTFHRPAMLWPSSQPIGNVAPFAFAKSATPSDLSSTEMPTTCTLPEFCFASSSSFGNDCLQGPHHVAQKSTTAILPESDSKVIEPFPFTVSILRSGAAFPTSAGPALPSPSVLGVIGGFLLPPHAEVTA